MKSALALNDVNVFQCESLWRVSQAKESESGEQVTFNACYKAAACERHLQCYQNCKNECGGS